jgi:hypothetical protein
MGRWLQRLKSENVTYKEPTKPTKPNVKTISIGNVSFVSSLQGHFQKLNDILLSTSFTLEMVLYGLDLWKQPFDNFDLEAIENGCFSVDQIVDYLHLWVKQHPNEFEVLKRSNEQRFKLP